MKKVKFAFVILSMLFFWCESMVLSQELILPNYKQYGLRDGLPQIQITTLFQDSRGYIWAGTNNGAARFNGEKFFSFTAKNGFPFLYINNFAEDKQGRVWVLCRQGIACISGDSITAFPQDNYLLQQMDFAAEDTIRVPARHRTTGEFVWGYFTDGEFSFTVLPFITSEKSIRYFEFKKNRNRVIYSDDENIYLSDHDKLDHNNVKPLPHPFAAEGYTLAKFDWLPNDDYLAIYGSPHRENILCFRFNESSTELIAEYRLGKCVLLPPENLREHLTFAIGLNSPYYLEKGEICTASIPGHNIRTILKDKNGGLWFGAEGGLLRVFTNAFTTYNPALLPEVWSVTEQPERKFWFGSFSFETKSMQNYKIQNEYLDSKKVSHYFHPSVNQKGDIYFALGNGIVKREPNGTTKHLQYENQGIPICFYTFYDRKRSLLLGGFRHNVAVWDDNDKLIREIGNASGMNISGFVHCIAQDTAYNYWFGTPNIYHYNWNTNTLKQYATSSEIGNCVDACTDHTGRTWFATSRGLYYYDEEVDSLKKINTPELQHWVQMVVPIDSSRLLLSQSSGLYILDLNEFNKNKKTVLTLYNESNGFLGGEPGQAGAFKDSEGQIWITGTSALSRLNPAMLPKADSLHLNLVFTKCNNTPILYEQTEIRLPHNHESATVVFDAVTFNRPSPVEYIYRTSRTKKWSKPQTENYIMLTELPHGKTMLYVQASLQGVSAVFSIVIRVNKAFYNQPWFIPLVLFLLMLTLIVMTLIYGRTQNRLQKTLMRAKYAEAETIQAQMNPHFVYNVLANVQSKIRNAKTDDAEHFLLKLGHLTRSFLHTSPGLSEADNFNPDVNTQTVSLAHDLNLLQEFIDFQQLLYPQKFIYRVSIDNDLDISSIRIPSMLLQPFVENAISHGLIPKGTIGQLHIDIGKDITGQKTSIRIIDDGIGMEQSRRLQQQSKLRYPSRGRKLTMRRIQLLNELGFRIEILTETSAEGTVVTILL